MGPLFMSFASVKRSTLQHISTNLSNEEEKNNNKDPNHNLIFFFILNNIKKTTPYNFYLACLIFLLHLWNFLPLIMSSIESLSILHSE